MGQNEPLLTLIHNIQYLDYNVINDYEKKKERQD